MKWTLSIKWLSVCRIGCWPCIIEIEAFVSSADRHNTIIATAHTHAGAPGAPGAKHVGKHNGWQHATPEDRTVQAIGVQAEGQQGEHSQTNRQMSICNRGKLKTLRIGAPKPQPQLHHCAWRRGQLSSDASTHPSSSPMSHRRTVNRGTCLCVRQLYQRVKSMHQTGGLART